MKNAVNFNNLKSAWRDDAKIFHKQLELNLEELEGNYPEHWNIFIDFVDRFSPKNILDIGCGCGAYYELCKRHFDIEYTGIDYSEHAIQLAKKHWGHEGFFVKDYRRLTPEDVEGFDLLHVGAMLDVLPNGDEALEFILSLKPQALLIGRMKLTGSESYYNVYTAYDAITTCEFYHNRDRFLELCVKYGYDLHGGKKSISHKDGWLGTDSNFLLIKTDNKK